MYEAIYENRLILKNNMKSTVANDGLGPFSILFFKKQAPSYISIRKSCVKLKIHIGYFLNR